MKSNLDGQPGSRSPRPDPHSGRRPELRSGMRPNPAGTTSGGTGGTGANGDSSTPVCTLRAARPVRGNLPLALVIAIDIFLVGAGLIVFSLFHHVLPRDVGKIGIQLPQATFGEPGEDSGPAAADPFQTASPSGTTAAGGSAAGPTGVMPTGAATSQPSTASSSPATAASTAKTSAAGQPGGSFTQKFPGKFTTGAVEKTATSYRSANISITMSQFADGTIAYSVADIYVSDLQHFRTAFATGKYGRGLTDTVIAMAARSKAVVAISGDYYGIRDKGVVIRNGMLYRDVPFQDVLILNNDGSMQTFAANGFDINAVVKRGAWQGWSFGPMLLQDGKPMTAFNSNVTAANPRGAIGYYEPGHYCFVLVDGRQPGYSNGMTMKQLSQLFADLGCKVAYNLDGGQSAVLAFQGAIFNRPYQGGREISDIVCIVDD